MRYSRCLTEIAATSRSASVCRGRGERLGAMALCRGSRHERHRLTSRTIDIVRDVDVGHFRVRSAARSQWRRLQSCDRPARSAHLILKTRYCRAATRTATKRQRRRDSMVITSDLNGVASRRNPSHTSSARSTPLRFPARIRVRRPFHASTLTTAHTIVRRLRIGAVFKKRPPISHPRYMTALALLDGSSCHVDTVFSARSSVLTYSVATISRNNHASYYQIAGAQLHHARMLS